MAQIWFELLTRHIFYYLIISIIIYFMCGCLESGPCVTLSDTNFSVSHQPTDSPRGLLNITVEFPVICGMFSPRTQSSPLHIRCLYSGEQSTGVIMAKVVPVQRGLESHKVSVVLLKCCSILFICK